MRSLPNEHAGAGTDSYLVARVQTLAEACLSLQDDDIVGNLITAKISVHNSKESYQVQVRLLGLLWLSVCPSWQIQPVAAGRPSQYYVSTLNAEGKSSSNSPPLSIGIQGQDPEA